MFSFCDGCKSEELIKVDTERSNLGRNGFKSMFIVGVVEKEDTKSHCNENNKIEVDDIQSALVMVKEVENFRSGKPMQCAAWCLMIFLWLLNIFLLKIL